MHKKMQNIKVWVQHVFVHLFEKSVVIANVGDSRAYVINSRQIEQITSDHSFVNHLVLTGQITRKKHLHIHNVILLRR